MIEQLMDGNSIVAIILKATYNNDGIEFFTPLSFSQQLGYMKRPKGYVVPAHIHKIVERSVTSTQEVYYIRSGKVRMLLFNTKQVHIAERILHKGDVILLADCCYGMEVLEDSTLLQVIQGPLLQCNEVTKVKAESVVSFESNNALC